MDRGPTPPTPDRACEDSQTPPAREVFLCSPWPQYAIGAGCLAIGIKGTFFPAATADRASWAVTVAWCLLALGGLLLAQGWCVIDFARRRVVRWYPAIPLIRRTIPFESIVAVRLKRGSFFRRNLRPGVLPGWVYVEVAARGRGRGNVFIRGGRSRDALIDLAVRLAYEADTRFVDRTKPRPPRRLRKKRKGFLRCCRRQSTTE